MKVREKIARTAWQIWSQGWVEDPLHALEAARGYVAFENEVQHTPLLPFMLESQTLYTRQCWQRYQSLKEEGVLSVEDSFPNPIPFTSSLVRAGGKTVFSFEVYATPRLEAQAAVRTIHSWVQRHVPLDHIHLVMMDPLLWPWVEQALKASQLPYRCPSKPLRETQEGIWFSRLITLMTDPDVVKLLDFLKHPLCSWGFVKTHYQSVLEVWESQMVRSMDKGPQTWASLVENRAHFWGPITKIIGGLERWRRALRACRSGVEACHVFQEIWQRATESAQGSSLSSPVWDQVRHPLEEVGQLFSGYAYSPLFQTVLNQLVLEEETLGQEDQASVAVQIYEAGRCPADLGPYGVAIGCHEQGWPRMSQTTAHQRIKHTLRRLCGFPDEEGQVLSLFHHAAECVLMRSRDARGRVIPAAPWWIRHVQTYGEKQGAGDEDLRPSGMLSPRRPQPCPALSLRPRTLSVTAFDLLLKDPYSFYARYILRLHEPVSLRGENPHASRGRLMHDFLFALTQRELSGGASVVAEVSVEKYLHDPLERLWLEAKLPEWERLWLNDFRTRDPQPQAIYAEHQGSWQYDAPQGPITLEARADRVDVLPDQTLRLIDYKTGQAPSLKAVKEGRAPQLLLEALIAFHGGFKFQKDQGLTSSSVASVEIWSLKGPADQITKTLVEGGLEDCILQMEHQFKTQVALYDQEATPYKAELLPPQKDPYRALKRVEEWMRS